MSELCTMQAANLQQLIHHKKGGGGERESVQPQMVRVAARGTRSHQALQGLSVNTGQAPKTDLLLAFVTGRGWGGLQATLTSGLTVEMAAQMAQQVKKKKKLLKLQLNPQG